MFKAGLATVLVAAVATPILLQQATIRRQDAELGRLRDASAELQRLREENARLATAQVDTNELSRLRAGNRELMRLRAEVARLRTAPERDEEEVGAVLADIPEESSESATNAPPPLFRVELSASLPMGSTLVTGGWMTTPGRRSLVLMKPQFDGHEGAEDRQVLITSTFAEAPEEIWEQCGLTELHAGTETATDGFVLEPEDAQTIMDLLSETEGVQILASPRVSVTDGNRARISSVGPRSDTGTILGASVELMPSISPDGQTVDLTVLAELGERNPEPPAVENLVRP
jgi:hypothetical protein